MESQLFAIFLIQALIFGLFCSFIAKEKGRNGVGWLFIGFFFSVLAVLALIAVPKKLETVAGGERKCPYCAEVVKAEAKLCRFCQRDLPMEPDSAEAELIHSPVVSQFVNSPDSRLTESQLMEKYGIGYDGNYLFQGRHYDKFSAALNDAKVDAKG